jgi:hypothetical protein
MRTLFILALILAPAFAAGQESALRRGFPTPDTSQKARDAEDFQRAVTAYRFWYPTVSCEGIFNGGLELGQKVNEDMMILSAGPRHVVFTANSDTPYGSGTFDLKDRPLVVELPLGPFIALADDHHQRWIMDMGLPGPDAGKGGKHLLLPPGYKGEVPSGYHVGRSASYKVLVAIRSLPASGDVDAAMAALRSIRIYPLSSAADPKLVKYTDITQKPMDGTCLRWEDNLQFWEKLHDVVEVEPVVPEFRAMSGLLISLGIEKGKPFAPDARMKDILERAAKAGRDQLLVSAFDSDRPNRAAWDDRKWEWVSFVSDNGNFRTPSGLDLEARDRWFAQAIVASPAMFRRSPGAGSLYWLGVRDRSGVYLDGGKTYKLSVPLPVPAGLFWSVTAYDAATRSEVQTDQDKAALRSLFELKDLTGDSVDLYFGPTAPAGKESHWIKTAPGKGWFAYFRIYGPKGPAFDGTWKPGDFEEVKD